MSWCFPCAHNCNTGQSSDQLRRDDQKVVGERQLTWRTPQREEGRLGLVATQPYRCRQKLTFALQTCSLCGWHSCRHGKRLKMRWTGGHSFCTSRGKQQLRKPTWSAHKWRATWRWELPQRRPDLDNLCEDHRSQLPKRHLQQPCCAVGRCQQRRRRQQSLQRR